MAYFQVEGGHRLHGEITPQGAKNEALQILCATLLTPRRVVVHNVPRILDVMQLIDPTLDKTSLPFLTTDAAVSSQELSIPRITISFFSFTF